MPNNQTENQQYKKPQVPPAISDDDDDIKNPNIDPGKKAAPSIKDKQPTVDTDDDEDKDIDTDVDSPVE